MLLKTKLYPPEPPQTAVYRNRLFSRLNEAYHSGKHITVTAGAGFGKSTMVTQWMNVYNIEAAWISLDEKDNDLRRFLSYLATALGERYEVDSKTILSLLSDSNFREFDLAVEMILESIGNQDTSVVIVLDDYHLITGEGIHKLMEYFLKHLTGAGTLILLARMDPPLSLSKLRLGNKLTEIRENELKFNEEEITELLIKTEEQSENRKFVTALLMSKTEGWVVGLQLALLAWKQDRGGEEFLSRFSGSHTFVADYLMEEVLQGLEPDEEQVLLLASLFDRFCRPLLDAIWGNGIKAQLDKIHQTGFFFIPLDDERDWYRFHHLVRDLLKKRALNSWNLQELDAIYLKAGHWFENSGYYDEAVYSFNMVAKKDELIRVISTYGLRSITSGNLTTVTGWLNLLTEDKRLSTPDLCVLEGWIASINQQIDRNEYISNTAESLFDNNCETYIEDIEAHLALLKANYLVQREGVKPVDIESLLVTAEQHAKSSNMLLHSIIQLYRGNVHRMSGELNRALSAYRKTLLYADQVDDFSLILPTTTAVSEIYFLQGNFTEAEQTLKQTLDKVYQHFSLVRIPKVGLLHILLAMILFEKNQANEASVHLDKAEEISDRTNDYNALVICYDLRARLHLLHNELPKAQEYLDRAVKLSERRHLLYYSAYLVHLTFLIRKKIGNKIAIEQCLDLVDKHNNWYGFWLGQLELTLVKTLFELDRLKEALEEAGKLKKESIARGAGFVEFQANCWICIINWKTGKKRDSLEALHKALLRAENTGIIRPLLDTGPEMGQIIKEYVADQRYRGIIALDFIQDLLKIFESELIRTPHGLSDPLSERELEVLRLLAAGLTNKEIADQLFLALGTVKKHSFTIYQKLGVKNRIQAVEKSRELRLI